MGGIHERTTQYYVVCFETDGKRPIHPPVGTRIDNAVITHAIPVYFDQLPSGIQEQFPEGGQTETSGTEQMLRRLAQEGSHPLSPVVRSLINHQGQAPIGHVSEVSGVSEDLLRSLGSMHGVFEVDKDGTLHSPPLEQHLQPDNG